MFKWFRRRKQRYEPPTLQALATAPCGHPVKPFAIAPSILHLKRECPVCHKVYTVKVQGGKPLEWLEWPK